MFGLAGAKAMSGIRGNQTPPDGVVQLQRIDIVAIILARLYPFITICVTIDRQ
jgi:hypothetical protein